MTATDERGAAIQQAAAAVLGHAGPECRADPHIPMTAMGRALDLGATSQEIQDEIARQRTQTS
jgi:hypothetical protein